MATVWATNIPDPGRFQWTGSNYGEAMEILSRAFPTAQVTFDLTAQTVEVIGPGRPLTRLLPGDVLTLVGLARND